MAISINPATLVISVAQADLTLVGGTLYSLDTNAFCKTVWDLQSAEGAIWQQPAFNHNTEVTFAGTTFARTIEFINSFSVTFENTGSAYTVRLDGSNNNIHDIDGGILNPTPLLTVVSTNSAGLIVVTTGSGLSAAQDVKLTQLHNDQGLSLAGTKTVTENTPDTDYTEVNSDGVTKTVITVGGVTTVDRTV